MVNASPAFAISCAKVPVLRELAAAVAFSPSLRAAVEHDYVQYIGRTEGADRISVTAEYVIASPARAHLFYSVEGGGRVSWELQTPDGTPLEGYSSAQYSGTAGEAEELRHTEFHFSRGGTPGGVPGRVHRGTGRTSRGSGKQGPGSGRGRRAGGGGSCGPHVPHPAGPGQDGRSQDGGGGHLGGGGRPAAEGGPAGGLPHPHGDPSPGGPGKYLLAGGGRVCLCRREWKRIRHRGPGISLPPAGRIPAPCSTITGRACISWRDRR